MTAAESSIEEFLGCLYAGVPPQLQACVTVWDVETRRSTHSPFTDTAAIVQAAAQREAARRGSFFAVGLTRPGLPESKKGGKRDIVALPAFFLDLDIAGPGHASKNLPTEDQAFEILSCAPEPSLIVHSGGGFHCYWIFEEALIISPNDVDRVNTMSEVWQQKFIDFAASKNLHVDQTGNIDRVLRLPGTSNFKTGTPRPVKIVFDGAFHKLQTLQPQAHAAYVAQQVRQAKQQLKASGEVDFEDLRNRMRNVSNARNRARMEHILRGEEFARAGARDQSLQSAVSTIAYIVADPETTDPVKISEIFRPSIDAMAAASNDPANPALTMDDVIEKMGRALQDAATHRANKKQEALQWMPWLAKLQEATAPPVEFERDKIGIGTDVEPVVDAMVSALAKLGRHDLRKAVFVNSGRLADVVADEDPSLSFVTQRSKDAPWIRTFPVKGLVERLSSAAEFSAMKKDKDGIESFSPCAPPLNFAEYLDARSSWPGLPRLEGIIETPALLRHGRILDEPGYDSDSGLFYAPNQSYLPVSAAPTQADAKRAMDELLDWTQDFPFKSPSDKSAVAALILTCLARHAIEGPVPAFAFTAPTPGSGKTKLLSNAILIALGRPASTMSLVDDEAEMDKRFLSIGLAGMPVAVFDDLPKSTLGTSALSRVLTDYSGKLQGRLLGKSRMVTATIKTIFVASGNNISYANTLARRVVECCIDPGIENPEYRTGFKYPDIQAHVVNNRDKLVMHALTILRAHTLAGNPGHTGEPMGSFERWDAVVRSAIVWTGYADPCVHKEQMRIASDADVESLRMLVSSWSALFGSAPRSIHNAILAARSRGVGGAEFINVLEGIDERLRPAMLGRAFGKWRDRVIDGKKFECAVNHTNKAAEWCVTTIAGKVIELAPAVVDKTGT